MAKHRKVHLFDIDVPGKITFKESDTLTGGGSITVVDCGFAGGFKLGVGICYDIRFPEVRACVGGCLWVWMDAHMDNTRWFDPGPSIHYP